MSDPRLYKDFQEWWRTGNHGFSSAGRDIVERIWEDLEPTILAGRTEWEEFLIQEMEDSARRGCKYFRMFKEYLEEMEIEQHAAERFSEWMFKHIK